MQLDFTYENPTKIYLGRNAMDGLAQELNKYGKNILLIYGKGAIKRIGLYDKIRGICEDCEKTVVELSGVTPNPTYAKVLEGCELIRKHNVSLILAAGGGSTIDCAKAVSLSAYCSGNSFQRYWIHKEDVDNRLIPVGCILTMAGTGSEMNSGTVITDEDSMIKMERVYPSFVNPKFSILNPEITYSVSKYQMVSGAGKSVSQLAEEGIDAMGAFVRECGAPISLRELGATEEILEKIAESSVKGGAYVHVNTKEILDILKAAY